ARRGSLGVDRGRRGGSAREVHAGRRGPAGARARREPRLEPGELGEIGAAPADLGRARQRAPRRDLATAAVERVHCLHAQGGESCSTSILRRLQEPSRRGPVGTLGNLLLRWRGIFFSLLSGGDGGSCQEARLQGTRSTRERSARGWTQHGQK